MPLSGTYDERRIVGGGLFGINTYKAQTPNGTRSVYAQQKTKPPKNP